MVCRVSDLRDKLVVCSKSGITLGPVCDIIIDTDCGKLNSLVIFGGCRYLGIFGREEDIIISWCDIKVIGPDTILVDIEPPNRRKFNNRFRK